MSNFSQIIGVPDLHFRDQTIGMSLFAIAPKRLNFRIFVMHLQVNNKRQTFTLQLNYTCS